MKRFLFTFIMMFVSVTSYAAPRVRPYTYMVVPFTAQNRGRLTACIASGHCVQTSLATVRKSIDGTQMIIKWNHVRHGPNPAPIQAFGGTAITHAQAVALMRTPAWRQIP